MTAGEIVETAEADDLSASAGAGAGAGAGAEDPGSEVGRLRARVSALEAELVEISARCNAAVAEAQAKTYWLERWHVDLNELMRRPGAEEIRFALRAVRSVGRRVRRLKSRLGS
jgi:hypothetical protein